MCSLSCYSYEIIKYTNWINSPIIDLYYGQSFSSNMMKLTYINHTVVILLILYDRIVSIKSETLYSGIRYLVRTYNVVGSAQYTTDTD